MKCDLENHDFEKNRKKIFPHTGPKLPHSRPAQKRECVIFCLGVRKNSIRSTGVKLASPHLVFATLAFGSGGNLGLLQLKKYRAQHGTCTAYL